MMRREDEAMNEPENKPPLFSEWTDLLKDQPEWLEMPVERALYERAESAAQSMGIRLEDAVFAFLMKLADGDISAIGITPEDFSSARLIREMEEGRRSGEEQGWASDDSVRDHIHGLTQDEDGDL